MRRVAALLSGVLVLALASPRTAEAQQQPLDNVMLTNGGRIRGHVMEDDATGVSVLMLDGTTKKIPRVQVMRVDYAESAAASKPAGPPGAPGPAGAPPAPAAAAPAAAVAGPPPAAVGGTPVLGAAPAGLPPATAEGAAFDRLAGAGIYVSMDVSGGGAVLLGGKLHHALAGGATAFTIDVMFPLATSIALGGGGAFIPSFGDSGFDPAGYFGATMALFPAPETGFVILLAGGFGGGGADGVGGIGPGLQLGLGYEFLSRHGAHPTLVFRFNYQGEDDKFSGSKSLLAWTLGVGVSYR